MENIEKSKYYKLLYSKKLILLSDQSMTSFEVNLPYYNRPETASLLKSFNVSIQRMTSENDGNYKVWVLTSKQSLINYGIFFYLVNWEIDESNTDDDSDIDDDLDTGGESIHYICEKCKLLDIPGSKPSEKSKLSLYCAIKVTQYHNTKICSTELKLFEDLDDGTKAKIF